MRLIKPDYDILTPIDAPSILKHLELCGRVCYKSEDKITKDSAAKFCGMILKRNHESVIEHVSMTVKFIIDRGVSHELVRHRLCSFSQESSRYCNYSFKKFDNHIAYIIPPWIKLKEGIYDNSFQNVEDSCWIKAMQTAEVMYFSLLELGWTPEKARSVLPNSLKTEIIVTANLREWRHIFKLRTNKAAHPQMREVMCPLKQDMQERLPEIFGGIELI